MIKIFHIGEGIFFNEPQVIGVFNNISSNKEILDDKKEKFEIRNESEINRSFILTDINSKYLCYFSRITGRNLIKRLTGNKQEDVNGKKGTEG